MKKENNNMWIICDSFIHNKSNISKLKNTLDKEKNLKNIIEYSKVMSDRTRWNILFLLYKEGKVCVCDLANILNMSSQAVSNQLIKLFDKWIISREKKWLSVFYSISNKSFISFLSNIL